MADKNPVKSRRRPVENVKASSGIEEAVAAKRATKTPPKPKKSEITTYKSAIKWLLGRTDIEMLKDEYEAWRDEPPAAADNDNRER